MRVGEKFGLARKQIGDEAHVVRVIGHHEKVERAREFRRLTGGGPHLLAAGEAVGITRLKLAAPYAGIH
jgi:hypothetical protein